MILFKCSCGTGLKVADEQAGEHFICPACMQEVSAPMQSDADCVLIYQDGGPADGFVIDRGNLEDKITNRELGAWDLIWQDDNWIPLGHVYQFEEEPAPAVEEQLPEIALRLSELPPIDGYARLPKQKKKKKSGGSAVESGGCFSHFREMTVAGRILFVLKILLVFCILGYGIYRTMKMVNYALKRSSAVMILNPTGENCEVSLDGQEWQLLSRGQQAVFGELYPPWSMRLSAKFRKDGSSPVFMTVKCPVCPGRLTVCNPGGRNELGIYRFKDSASLQLKSSEFSLLGKEIAGGRAPQSAETVARQLQELGKKILVRTSKEPFFRNDAFDFSRLPFSGTVNDMKCSGAVEETLCWPLQQELKFKNCLVSFRPDSYRTQRSVHLTEKLYRLKNGKTVTAPAGIWLKYYFSGDTMRLQSQAVKGNFRYQQKELSGGWTYSASLKDRAWKWEWIFEGRYQNRRIRVIQNMDGREKIVL